MNDLFATASPLRWSRSVRFLAFATVLLCWCAPQRASAVIVKATATKSADAEFKALLARDEDARQDMSRWLTETAARDEHFADKPHNVLSLRMEHRLQLVCDAYAAFRARHPDHNAAEMLEDAFRADITEDLAAVRHWEAGRAEVPGSPAPWNELAHHLGHSGRTVEAFVCFEKSLSLSPREAVYFFDFATALLLYRSDAARHYKLTEQAVFEKVLILYRRGMRLEPDSFAHATGYAETFYLITPARPDEGVAAWKHAFSLADTDAERDQVRTHLARYAINAGHPNLARAYLVQVNEPRLEPVKLSLLRRVNEAGKPEKAEAAPATQ